jgi:hypothetical protein
MTDDTVWPEQLEDLTLEEQALVRRLREAHPDLTEAEAIHDLRLAGM